MNSNEAVTTNVAIQHPNIFYYVLDASWSSTNSLEFWNKGNAATTVNNYPVYKTIFSPSPTGYVEPRTAAFTGLTLSNINGTFNNGYSFFCNPNRTGVTIFFPILGIRDAYSGRVNNSTAGYISLTDSHALYHSAGPSTNAYYCHIFMSYNNYSNTQYEYIRAYGCTSRPVLE